MSGKYTPPVFVTIVVPTYKERANIAPLAQRLFETIDPQQAELLIVDDNSPDGTALEAERLSQQYPVRCVVRREERGLATAVIAGLRAAQGEWIVVMDADLSHPPESVPALLDALRDERVNMAMGSRSVAGASIDQHWPLHRRLFTAVAKLLARPLTSVRDMTAGFFAVRRAELNLDALRPIGYKIALELIVRHRWKRVTEIPIHFSERVAGHTKLDFAEQMRYLRHLGRLYAHVMLPRRSSRM